MLAYDHKSKKSNSGVLFLHNSYQFQLDLVLPTLSPCTPSSSFFKNAESFVHYIYYPAYQPSSKPNNEVKKKKEQKLSTMTIHCNVYSVYTYTVVFRNHVWPGGLCCEDIRTNGKKKK
uniref:Uncharacterized protein n=1 Tax=Glossina pallidipes TaxID=7398 RepID=A0A1A9ZJF1_GLOPL